MSNELEHFQPDYDLENKTISKYKALKEKIQEKIAELKKTPKENELIIFRAEYRTEALDEQIKALNNHIFRIVDNHNNINPYESYKKDLKENQSRLEKRRKEYETIYSQLCLITEDENGDTLRPKSWYLDEEGTTFPKAFKPVATRTIATQAAVEGKNTNVEVYRKYNYSNAFFYYADDGTVLRDRFVLYWRYDDKNKVDSQSQSSEAYRPDYLRAAYVTSGVAKTIDIDSRVLDNIKLDNDEDFYTKRYQLSSPVNAEYIGEAGDYRSPYRYSKSNIELNGPTAFFLYPLDQGKFLTKKLSDLSKIDAPEYPSRAKDKKVIFEGGEEPAPEHIYLHCPLPEWNHRLREALTELQQQVNEFNLIMAPHYQKLAEVGQMRQMMELHNRHAYRPKENVTSEEKEARLNLTEAFENLTVGIQSIIENPSDANGATFAYAYEKKHINECAGTLWRLLQSPALYSEIEHYINYIDKKDFPENEMPAGPYMEEEKEWFAIFNTIAECYAALSVSDIYAQQVWDNDLIHGINQLANLEQTEGVDQELTKTWKNISNILRADNDSDANEVPEYLREQGAREAFKNQKEEEPQNSLFGLIINKYDTLAKPYLGHLVPGPGAPCTLQVVLSCYQPQFTKLLLKAVKSDSTYHLRIFKNVLIVFTIINGRNSTTKLSLGSAADIFKSLIVTKDISKSNKRVIKTLLAFKKFFNDLDEGKEGTSSKIFFDDIVSNRNKYVTAGASYGKVVYTVFNLVLSFQYLQAIAEKAESEDWPTERIYLEYINATLQVAMGFGTSTMAFYNLASRMKYFGLSNLTKTDKAVKISQKLSDLLDNASVHLAFVQTILSAYYAADHIKNENYKEAAFQGISATAGIMLTIGFLLRRAAQRAVARELAQLTIAGITASTGVGTVVAGIFLIVGTAINIALLVRDIGNILKSALASDSQKYLETCWMSFKSPLKEINRNTIENAGLSVTHYSRSNGTIWGLAANPLYNKQYDILKLYNTVPYELYSKEIGGWKSSNTFLTVDPIKKIEDLHKQDLMFDGDSVRLGSLNWRAIIPLHLMNIDKELIDDMVEFGFGLYDYYWDFEGFKSASDIINYYEEVKEILDAKQKNNTFNIKNDTQYSIAYMNPKGEIYRRTITELLERGEFDPGKDGKFHKSEKWNHEVFRVKDIYID